MQDPGEQQIHVDQDALGLFNPNLATKLENPFGDKQDGLEQKNISPGEATISKTLPTSRAGDFVSKEDLKLEYAPDSKEYSQSRRQGEFSQSGKCKTTEEEETSSMTTGQHYNNVENGSRLDRRNYWTWSQKEPPLQPGMIRIRFRCACQAVVWDDYPDTIANAAKSLEHHLDRHFRQAVNSSRKTVDGRVGKTLRSFFSVCARGFRSLYRSSPGRAQGHSGQSIDSEAQQNPSTSSESATTSFYLTCATQDARIPTLVQSPAASIHSDLEYFDLLRKIINDQRWTLRGTLRPRKIISIRYVKFELLFDNKHVEIRKTPDFPEDNQHYQPSKGDFEREEFCPWGPNLLLHFFERRHECPQHPKILARIPRKLKEKLVVTDTSGVLMGWGMQLDDGLDGLRVGIMGIIGLMLSSVFGILWAKLHGNDVQGGTGLTQCLMAFVTFLVTMHGIVGFVEERH
ncbi:uncharacterized protein Z518_02454 [Rhinocladiella mackenziei CBS 650.93]|uniref:Uncharacterized protein n=1 Tax=Rhinocladiella mackenziei CBS 650.93 TaxID=1442369 RepID=A0A0D2JF21_9EURO|nr:uncharacterized protein Z518_02454 [Rhinocladiella mackenziei CBS 650.93]KIX07800.1 hypothetical protein Z518_02454 [Rhinocladiella mackenziei CBS 650.93]